MTGQSTYQDYLRPRSHSLWRWDDGHEFIASLNGRSICPFEEIYFLLGKMRTQGWPSLDAVLVLMELASNREIGMDQSQELVETAGSLLFLRRFNRWSKQFRNSLQGQFNKEEIILRLAMLLPQKEVVATEGWLHLRLKHSRKELKLDEVLQMERPTILPADEAINLLGQTFLDYSAFERYLLSGFEEMPSPEEIESEVGELPEAKDAQLSLLEELLQIPETAGIAHAAKALLAFMKLPQNLNKFGDQALGGVSDISNRGSLDRLLISELAQDDLVLTARLANQEALYLRKESPPEEDKPTRNILLDTTIRMWGSPRVIGLASCLAAVINRRPKEQLHFHTLEGEGFKHADLHSKFGMADLLRTMSAHLHSGQALEAFFAKRENQAASNLLITSEENLLDAGFSKYLLPVQVHLDFMLSIQRDGSLELFQLKSGVRRSIRKAKLDLDLLNKRATQQNRKFGWVSEELQGTLPAFSLDAAPLRFPKSNHSVDGNSAQYQLSNGHLIMVTKDRRLLIWDRRSRGAIELSPNLPVGAEMLHSTLNGQFALIIQPKNPLIHTSLHYFDLETWTLSTISLGQLKIHPIGISFSKDEMLFRATNLQAQTHDYRWTLEGGCNQIESGQISRTTSNETRLHRIKIHNYIKQSGSIFCNYGSISISKLGKLMVGGKVLQANDIGHYSTLEWLPQAKASFEVPNVVVRFPKIGKEERRIGELRFIRHAQSGDGTLIFADQRGFLHLRSSRTQLPEVTIVTLVGAGTTAWASDGCITGHAFFQHPDWQEKGQQLLAPMAFYERYIQPILAEIRMP